MCFHKAPAFPQERGFGMYVQRTEYSADFSSNVLKPDYRAKTLVSICIILFPDKSEPPVGFQFHDRRWLFHSHIILLPVYNQVNTLYYIIGYFAEIGR